MKRYLSWIIAALVLVGLAVGVQRALTARQQQQQALTAARSQAALAPLTLAAQDVLVASQRVLPLEVPVAGAVRALDTAWIKARTAGELQLLNLREGDAVQQGATVARIDPTESAARLRQAQQQAAAAQAQVDINQRQYNNNRALVDQGFISPTALVTSQASLEAAQASYQAAVAAVDVARKALDDSTLRSPIAGLVSQRVAQPGERMPIDGRILEVVDLRRMELEALVPSADATRLRIGQQAQLRVDGHAEAVAAKVARISPAAQPGNRAVPVYLLIEQPAAAPLLRQGQFVQGSIRTGQAQSVALPLDAVRTDRPAPYVQAIIDGRVAHVAVQPGARATIDGASWVAVEGLAEGASVIAGRLGTLREGTVVSMAPTASAGAATASSPPAGAVVPGPRP